MKKFLVLILFLFPIVVNSLTFPETNSIYVEIYDLTDNKVLYESNSSETTSIASLTKIATTITAIENFENLNEKITISSKMINSVDPVASKAGLNVGDQITILDLLYASMLPSGADATNSLAIASCGTQDCFVTKMNALAKKLNLKNTTFKNVTGLDEDGHKSSASDVRKLLTYALKNKTFRKIFTTKEYTLSNGLKVRSTLYKYSSGMDPNAIIGGKTGYTIDAGYCLASLNNINGHEVILIVLNAEKKDGLYYNIVDTKTLTDFMRLNYQEQILVKKDELIKTIPIKLSKTNNYSIKASKNITKYLPSDYDKSIIKTEYKGKEKISFLSKKGDKLGYVNYYYNNDLIAKENIYLKEDPKLSISKLIKSYFIILVIPIIFITIKKRKK